MFFLPGHLEEFCKTFWVIAGNIVEDCGFGETKFVGNEVSQNWAPGRDRGNSHGKRRGGQLWWPGWWTRG